MPDTLFPRSYSETLTTKRGVTTGVKRAAPSNWITTPVRCSPVFPMDPTAKLEAKQLRGVSVDSRLYCDPADIVAEDIVVTGGVQFTVIEVNAWPVVNPRVLEVGLRTYKGPP